ncbi:MAG: TIGR04255 family protein [Candidatus Thiodiazotropha endolucinida]
MKRKSLPTFSTPPLSEVALSVQFEPLQKLVVPEIGLLWQHYGQQFSHVEQHPPIDPTIERLGVRAVEGLPKIERLSGPPLPRIWFLDDTKRELLQIQQDRFVRNWRKINEDDPYPRYDDHIKPRFVEDLADFEKFIASSDIGKIIPNQCEVTYINHIVSSEVWSSHSEIHKVFNLILTNNYQSDNLDLEDVSFRHRYQIKDDNGEFIGRLYATAQPAMMQSDNRPIFVFTLVARGKPLEKGIDGVIRFMDLGRELIVEIFAESTSTEMHALWKRLDK